MRPVQLTVEGLACFREKQEIDFSELDLFAISGPTGAGKSTVLDAMLFALYGNIPRVGKNDLKEMISAARDRVSVMFDFDVGDQRFRITRALRRKGAAAVRLEKHDGLDFNENVADQVKTVREEITRILGLGSDAFTQAVMLPQGEFARFLKSDPKDRRSMLRRLLRLEVYERMRDKAQSVSNEKKASYDSAQRLLSTEYQGVTSKSLAALEAELKKGSKKLEVLRKDRDAADEQLAISRGLRTKTEELEQKEKRHKELNQVAEEIAAAKSELDAAQRATSLVSVVEEAARAAGRAKLARETAEEARLARVVALKAHQRKDTLLQQANTAAAKVRGLRDKVAALNQVLGRLPERDGLMRSLERQRTDLKYLDEEADALRQRKKQLGEEQREQRIATKTARGALSGVNYDADLDAALEDIRELATELSVAREGLKRTESTKSAQQHALTELTKRIESLDRRAKAASRVEEKAQRTFDAADEALHDAHRMDEANHLREYLVAGEKCPVCNEIVEDPPSADRHPKIEKAKDTREKAALKLDRAEKKVLAAVQTLAAEQANADTSQRSLKEADGKHRRALMGVARWEKKVRARLGGRACDEPIEAWVLAQVRISAVSRKAYQDATRKLEEAERELTRVMDALANTKERLKEKDEARCRLEAESKDTHKRLKTLRKEIADVTRSPSPERERDSLAAKIAELESKQKRAADDAARTKSELAVEERELKLQTKAARQAEQDASRRQKTRDSRVGKAGFGSTRAVEEAVREDRVQAQLRHRIDAHEREADAVGQRIGTLKKELGDRRISEAQLETAKRRASALGNKVESLVGNEKRLEQQVESMEQRLARSRELRQQLKTAAEIHRRYHHLATDLRSDKFQAYVLEEAFTELVRGASTRLLTLTGERYSLEFVDDQIVVVDHDNAGETRVSDTLSGGETFLTSLSLALELSDQVQRAAGAVNLDSLFVDEGFGTLDPDTLAVVSETFQSLQVGGRMVGIITHIPELRDEFNQQILVTKHQGYSTLEVRV